MGIFELGSSAFDEYSADECEIGIDLNKITDLLGITDKERQSDGTRRGKS